VEISVTDTGIGIAEEDQSKVLRSFARWAADYAHKEARDLTLAKKFVELHGRTDLSGE